jgi:hypothetical protein
VSRVFQPPKVKPGFTIVPTVGRELKAIGDSELTSVSELLDAAPEAPFGLYVITATHLAYKVTFPVEAYEVRPDA